MSVRKAVFPAAGLGTRFLPATKAQPKEMLPLVDKPTIQYVVEEAVASGLVRDHHRHRPQQARDRGPLRRGLRARVLPGATAESWRSWPRSRPSPSWRRCPTCARRSRSASATPSCAPARWWATSRSASSWATTSSAGPHALHAPAPRRLRPVRRPGARRRAGAARAHSPVRRHRRPQHRRQRLGDLRPRREAGARGGAVRPGHHRPLRADARSLRHPGRDRAPTAAARSS